jgi:hypothetical protein
MRKITIMAILLIIFSCDKNKIIDLNKRDTIVKKYDLLNFPNIKQPILLTVDEFFDGNNDEASIAPNLIEKPNVAEYYKVLKNLSENPKVNSTFVKLNEVMIYDNGKLNDNEWFFADMVYVIGDLTKEEIKEFTKSLKPDDVEYDSEMEIRNIDPKYKDKKIVYIWWD